MKLFIWILYNPSEGLTKPLTGAVGYWTNRSFVSASEAWEPNIIDPRAEMKSSGPNLWNKTIDLRVPLNSSQLIWYIYLQRRAILCSRWMQVQVRWLRTHAEHGIESATRGGRRLYTDARTRVWRSDLPAYSYDATRYAAATMGAFIPTTGANSSLMLSLKLK